MTSMSSKVERSHHGIVEEPRISSMTSMSSKVERSHHGIVEEPRISSMTSTTSKVERAHRAGRIATARSGAPLPRAIFIGNAMTCAPVAGS